MDALSTGNHRRPRRRPTYRHLALACLALGTLDVSAECLPHGDQSRINKLLSDGGPDAKIHLCQGRTYEITSPIIFTAKNQEIATEGYPTEEALKARIVLRKEWGGGLLSSRRGVGGDGAAIIGDCRRCAQVAVRNLVIDGNRAKLGRVLPSEAGDEASPLVLLGGNEGQVVSGCTIRDPRGWTAIQLREGDNLSCEGAVVEDNTIGPAGEEWDPAVDGDDPENSPIGRPLASGLSLACRSSTVQRNVFVDTTDAAIVIYGSPGSLIASNHIISSTRSQMAGILMADLDPFDGDYTNTRVINNTFEAEENALMRVAIGLGAAVLSDDTETVIRGGVVRGNKIKGIGMGYGIAASGLQDFTVLDNESTARHGGRRGAKCLIPVDEGDEGYAGLTETEREHGVVRNPLPIAFLRNGALVQGGEWQDDFMEGEFSYLVCIDPDAVEGEVGEEQKVEAHPAPEPAEAPVVRDTADEPTEQDEPDTPEAAVAPGTAVFDDILTHSQARMLEAIAELGRNVDSLVGRAAVDGGRGTVNGRIGVEEGGVLAQLAELSTRIAKLESERSVLRKTIEGLNQEVDAFGQNLAGTETQEDNSVEELLNLLSSNTLQGKTPRSDNKAMPESTADSWVMPFVYLLGSQVVIALVGLVWTKLRRRDKGHKDI